MSLGFRKESTQTGKQCFFGDLNRWYALVKVFAAFGFQHLDLF